MKFFELIKGIVEKLFKKESSDSQPSVEEEVIVEKAEIEPKLTVSDKEPTGGEDRDVWLKYEGGE